MENVLITLVVIFLVAAILVGSFTENTWKNTGITWALLSISIILFGITLTL